MKTIKVLHVLIFIGVGLLAYPFQVQAQVASQLPIVTIPFNTPVILIPNDGPMPKLITDTPVITIPKGPVIVVPPKPSAIEERIDTNCSVEETKCAEINCLPLPNGYSSYRACIIANCETEEEDCIFSLVKHLRTRVDVTPEN